MKKILTALILAFSASTLVIAGGAQMPPEPHPQMTEKAKKPAKPIKKTKKTKKAKAAKPGSTTPAPTP